MAYTDDASGSTAPQPRVDPATVASCTPVPAPPQQEPYIPHRRSSHAAGSRFSRGSADRRGPSAARGTAVPRTPADPAAYPAADAYDAAPDADYDAPRPPRTSHRAHLPRRPRHGFLSFLLWLVMLAVAGLLALRLLPLENASGRLVPELVSFVPLALAPTLVVVVLALLWHRRVLLVVSSLALALNGWWHAGYLLPTARVSAAATAAVSAQATTDDAYARVMTLNCLAGNASAADIVRVVREQHVEVLCLQEINDGMVSDLENAGIDEVLPYHVVSTGATSVSNGGRNGIWTLAPQDNVSRNLLPIETSSMPAANVQVGSRTVRVVSVHPNSPTRGAQDLWDEGLSVIGSLSSYDHAYLIMGDFNSTWDHARFRDLLGSSFMDASQQSGEGFHMTYPSNKGVPSLIEIDHIVYARDSGITVSSLEAVEIAGTDHKALVATLEAR